jgi:IS1 family transposase
LQKSRKGWLVIEYKRLKKRINFLFLIKQKQTFEALIYQNKEKENTNSTNNVEQKELEYKIKMI